MNFCKGRDSGTSRPGTEGKKLLSQLLDGAGHSHMVPALLLHDQVRGWEPLGPILTPQHVMPSFSLTARSTRGSHSTVHDGCPRYTRGTSMHHKTLL
eukprot:1111586-Pelagomonas_calceolata.AAC.1